MSINYRALTCTARAAPDRWGKRGRVREEDGNGGGGGLGKLDRKYCVHMAELV